MFMINMGMLLAIKNLMIKQITGLSDRQKTLSGITEYLEHGDQERKPKQPNGTRLRVILSCRM